MPRQINSKLILRTAGTLLLVVAVVLVMGRLLHRKAVSEVLPRARKLAEEEKYSKAAELYELHLEGHDDDKDALEEYANVLIKTARGRRAADIYRKIVSLDPKDYDALLWLTRFTIVNAAGVPGRPKPLDPEVKWAEAAALGSKMIQLEADRPEGYRCLAQAQIALKKFEDADKTLEKLIAKHPDEETAYFQRAEIARRQERPVQEWRRHIEECLEKNPKSWSAHLQAYIFLQLRDVAGAEEYLKRALEIGPDEPAVLANAGLREERLARKARQEKDDEVQKKHWEAARQYWKKLQSVDGTDYRSYGALARIEWANHNSDVAIKLLRDGLDPDQNTRGLALRYQLGEMLVALGRTSEVHEQLTILQTLASQSPYTAFLEGYSLLAEKQFEQARVPLERAARGLPRSFQVYLMLGRCYLELGEPGEAKAKFAIALKLRPGSVNARYSLARALLYCGDTAAAVQAAEKVTEVAPERQDGWITLAQALYATSREKDAPENSLEQAIEAARKAVEIRASAGGLLLLAGLYNAVDQPEKTEATLRREPADPEDHHRLLLALVQFHKFAGRLDQARKAYDDLVNQHGETLQSRLVAAQLIGSEKREDVEQELLDILANAAKDERIPVRRALVRFYMRGKDPQREKAIQQLEAIIEAQPRNTADRRFLFRIALDKGDGDLASKMVDQLTEIEGLDSPRAICDRVECDLSLALRSRQEMTKRLAVRKALVTLKSLCETTPSARAWAILGDAYTIDLSLPEAIRCYRNALQANPGMVQVGVALVSVLKQAGRRQEADLALDRLLKAAPSASRVLDLEFRRYERQGNLNAAIEIKKQQLELYPDNVRILLTLAQLLRKSGDREAAEKHLRHAYAVDPYSPAVVSDLALLLQETDRAEDGMKLCDDFVAERPSDRAAFICRAGYRQALGQFGEATEDLLQALKFDPEGKFTILRLGDMAAAQDDRDTAMDWYRKAAELEPPGTYARKNLIEKLLVSAKPEIIDKVNTIVDAMLEEEEKEEAQPDFALHLLKSRLAMLNYNTLDEAREHCLRAIELAPGSAAPRIQMSAINQAEGNLRRAIQEASHALLLDPRSLRAIMLNVDLLRREERYAEAKVILKRARQTPQTISVQASLIDSSRGAADAVEYLQTRIAEMKEDVPVGSRRPLLLRLAYYLNKSGNTQEAEAQLRSAYELDKNSFSAVTGLARFLDQQKRYEETDRLLNEAERDKAGPELAQHRLMHASLLMGRNRGADDLAEADRLAQAILAEQPDSSAALRMRGDVANLNGKKEEAIALFRQALNADVRNAYAANSLAWILSETGRHKEALPHARNAVHHRPGSPNLLDTLGVVYYRLGNYRESERKLRKCVMLSPNAAKSWYRLGRTLVELNKLDEAGKTLERAKKEDEKAGVLSDEQKEDIERLLAKIKELLER